MLEFKANLHSFVVLFFSPKPERGVLGLLLCIYQGKNKFVLALIYNYGTSYYIDLQYENPPSSRAGY